MRYFFHIGYHGTNYSGWQITPNGIGVQQILEQSLSRIFKQPTHIIGCGRTDANVHASQFFFHLDINQAWDFDLVFRLNNVLPDDIAVFDIIPVDDKHHARFGATFRSYDYFIHSYKDPFLGRFSSMYVVENWDVDSMDRAAKLLLKYNDYRAFCKMPDRNLHNLCEISEAAVFINNAGNRLRFRISANRFLGKMVRIITDKLIEIGSGKLSIDAFEAHLINPQLPQIIKPAYPQGLFLSKVAYPYLNIPSRSNFTQMLAGIDEWKKPLAF